MNPDKLFSLLKYTHPTMIERLEKIDLYIIQITKKDTLADAYLAY